MSFEMSFCASPWFHARINNNGSYEYCRWALKHDRMRDQRIQTMTPQQFFQQGMSPIRQQLLAGEKPEGCAACHRMEQHGKVSGRQKQLLKAGVSPPVPETMRASPWFPEWQHSDRHEGETDLLPQDWQIDLGNYCNSACLFCTPHSSSRLAQEHHKLGLINSVPPRAWCDDPALLDQFVHMLEQTPRLAYLHFIGGETMITPAFRRILAALIDRGLAARTTLGFTTNLTVWDDDLMSQLACFQQINLGVSIECLHPLNDYLRWPSELATTEALLDRWRDVSRENNWLMQIRVTPTVFSIWHLDTIYRYALANDLAVESCDFLDEPAHMRMSLLPHDLRQQIQQRLRAVAEADSAQQVINTRDPNQARSQILQDRDSYVRYLDQEPVTQDLWPHLINYLHVMERSRANRVLDYLPEYEEFLRSAGYQH